MSKYVKNDSGSSQTWVGQLIADDDYYLIAVTEEIAWANDSEVLSAIGSGDAVMAKSNSGSDDITDVVCAIDFLRNNLPIDAPPDYSESFWKEVNASTDEESTGVVIPDGETVAVRLFQGEGESPDAYTFVAFDYGGANEKVIFSTIAADKFTPDIRSTAVQVTGDGTAKLQVVIKNDNTNQTGMIGAYYEAVKV